MGIGLDLQEQAANQAKQLACQLLDEAIALSVGLSDDESVYDLIYIGQRLAQCSSYMEKLSDMQLKLTKLTVQVLEKLFAGRGMLRCAEVQSTGPADRALLEQSVLIWESTARVVKEVKEAVESKAAMVKRLDSDIRLHQKLLEAKIAAGADAQLGFHSTSKNDLAL